MTVIYTYASPVIGGLALLINLIQILAIVKTNSKKKLSNSTVFILNLSISDGFVGFIVVSVKIMDAVAKSHRGLFANKEFRLIFEVSKFMFFRMSLMLSVLNLVAITIDRLICVVQPFKYRIRLRKIYVFVCISLWLVAFFLALSLWLLIRNNRDFVWLDTLLFPAITIPGSLLLLASYAFIWLTLRNQDVKLSLSMREGTNNYSPTYRITPSPKTKRLRVRQQQKTLRLMIAMVFAFVVCWMPLAVCSILLVTGSEINNTIRNSFFLVAISNSVINPMIYFQSIRAKLNKKLLNVFKKLQRGKTEKAKLTEGEPTCTKKQYSVATGLVGLNHVNV